MQRSHMKLRSIRLAVTALTLACASSMGATPTLDPQTFSAQRAAIEEGLKAGGIYAEMDSTGRDAVAAALQRISATFDRNGGTPNLSSDEQVQVFNDQELINTILTKAAEDSRIVCERQVRRGSHIKTNKCMKLAERRRQAAATAETMRMMQSKPTSAVPEGTGK